MKEIKTIFMGTPAFSVSIAEQLKKEGCNIQAVVTQPDREAGRGKKITFSPVKEWALENNVPVLQPEKARNPEFIEEIKSFSPDLIVTAAFGQIIPKEILDIPAYGCINVHASLLPEYRGASPIQQALFDGKKITGITIMYMNEKMDEGDIIVQKSLEIDDSDNSGTLFEKMAVLGAEAIHVYMLILDHKGKPSGIPQDADKATYCKKIEKERGNIDWTLPSDEIGNVIRAMTPTPGAYSFLNGKRIKIIKALSSPLSANALPGCITKADKNGIEVSCGSGTLIITSLQPEGKSVQAAKDFLNGNRINAGMEFERNI